MNKRASGPPRRPRDPVAKAVRTPAFKMRVVPDKRWKAKLEEVDKDSTDGRAEENDKKAE
jgi:hypothetical protein